MVTRPLDLPIEGKMFRFAPGRGGEPAARFWKVWAEGNEVYALARMPEGIAKISVHESGQIHLRTGPKRKQDLAPIMGLGAGPWLHAVEIRFLLSAGAKRPTSERESLKRKSAYVVPVPEGFFLCTNLILSRIDAPTNTSLPVEFAGARTLWRTQLRNGRTVVLAARVLALDAANSDRIKYIREKLKPTVTFSGVPTDPYVEIWDLHWSPSGNIVSVVPMGNEAIRSEQEISSAAGPARRPRRFRYQSSRASAEIIAPNGKRVATLHVDSVDTEIDLVKDQPSECCVGTVSVRLDAGNLIASSKFMASPRKLVSVPIIGGGSPRNWEYTILSTFDGSSLSVEIQRTSAAIRNNNPAIAVSGLGDSEEVVIAIPSGTLKLDLRMEATIRTADLVGKFTLRDVR
jgi:hypothetical protein